MKRSLEEMITGRGLAAVVVGAGLLASPGIRAQEQTATVHGHAQNPAGQTLTSGTVKFTKDLTTPFKDEKFTTTVPIGQDGNYNATGVAPGEYFIYVVQNDKAVDRMQVVLKAGDNKTVDFDMTREEYTKGLTPEEKKAIEDFKAKNAAAVSSNKQIANLNATILAVRADIKTPTPNFDKDISDMKQATDARPNEGLLWSVTGDVYYNQGRKLAAADRTNKTNPLTDDAVKSAYENATTSLQKAADLLGAGAKPNVEAQAGVYNQLGNVFGEQGKAPEASAAFEKAATLDPKGASMYYTNEAIVFDHTGGGDPEVNAANKAITADPTKPLPYYLKGQALLAKATVDAKGVIVAPPGCVDAYQKYLELAPDGPQAPAVKEVLTSLGQKVETKYRAGKK